MAIEETVNRLIDAGKIAQARIEEQRALKLKKELAECYYTPKIKRSNSVPQTDVIKRFEEHEKNRKQRIDEKKKKVVEEELESPTCTFQPKISRRARSLGRRNAYRTNSAWLYQRQEKLDELRRKQVRNEFESMRQQPEISQRSQRIMYRKDIERRRKGIPECNAFADQMLERSKIAKYAAQERLHEQELQQCPGTPRITVFAAKLQREGEVCDRLYEMFLEKRERQMEQMVKEDYDHKPLINPNAKQLKRSLRIEDELLARHEDSLRQKTDRLMAITQAERESHQPLINPVSHVIASRLPTTTQQRLLSPRTPATHPQDNAPQGRGGYGSGHSHAPSGYPSPSASRSDPGTPNMHYSGPGQALHAHADAMSSHTMWSEPPPRENRKWNGKPTTTPEKFADHLQSMLMKEEMKKERLARLREEREEQMMGECTFRPSGNQAEVQGTVYDRVLQWEEKRKARLHSERRKREDEGMEECTFIPNTARTYQPPSRDEEEEYNFKPQRTSRGATVESPLPSGYEEFISRQQEARERRVETKNSFATGKHWSNTLTRPQPFSIGESFFKHIPALQKPMTAVQAQSINPDLVV